MSGHGDFTLACAYSLAGKSKQALSHCQLAIDKYKENLDEYPDVDWVTKNYENATSLLSSIVNKSTNELFVKWRDFTVEALKLNKLLDKKSK